MKFHEKIYRFRNLIWSKSLIRTWNSSSSFSLLPWKPWMTSPHMRVRLFVAIGYVVFICFPIVVCFIIIRFLIWKKGKTEGIYIYIYNENFLWQTKDKTLSLSLACKETRVPQIPTECESWMSKVSRRAFL